MVRKKIQITLAQVGRDFFCGVDLEVSGYPISSGLIESGHKNVLQAHVKIPEVAWKMEIAENIVFEHVPFEQTISGVSIGIKIAA